MDKIEHHPLEPFVFPDSKILMLGSFPPKRERWSMDFYYPNFQNDMWRIFGLVFENDKNYFLADSKHFDVEKIVSFLKEKGIAISDTACSVIRHKDNASDNFLEIVDPRNIPDLIGQMPVCKAIVTTGQKASETLASGLGISIPKIRNYTEFKLEKNTLRFYRMPSSSRAYPLSLDKKAAAYKIMFSELGLL